MIQMLMGPLGGILLTVLGILGALFFAKKKGRDEEKAAQLKRNAESARTRQKIDTDVEHVPLDAKKEELKKW